MNAAEFIQQWKDYGVIDDAIIGIPLDQVVAGVAAWKFSESKVMDEENIFLEGDETPTFLWYRATFKNKKWLQAMAKEPQPGLLPKLINANLIFPDGSVNEDWLHSAKQKLQNAGKQKWGNDD